jgi:periplasmic mercuric ion binding protein
MKKLMSFISLSSFILLFTAISVAQTPSGNTPTYKSASYTVNMHCESCKQTISKCLAYEKGVKNFDVNLEQKKVTVSYDPTKTTSEKISADIAKLGYEVKPFTAGTNCPQGGQHNCTKPCKEGMR